MAPPPLSPHAHLPHLGAAVADFAAILETGDLDAPVPGCAPWRLTDLAHHLGGIHRWARGAVLGDPPDDREPVDAPTERGALVAWFRDGADPLLSTLRDTDPAAPCWGFGPRPHTAAFWFRRQTHETAAHAGDAAASQGTTRPYGAELALDGIDETVGVFFPRQVRLGRTAPLPHALAVEADEGGRWVFAGDGTAWLGGEAPDRVDGTVSGPAEALLPLLWHRIPLEDSRLSVSGDRHAVETVLACALAS
ncbi:MAG: hypothetical protein QOK35_1200 [Pseudonocardiales bacterium]|nr:hypothetical protein [Pseudonocardiales bacterium]